MTRQHAREALAASLLPAILAFPQAFADVDAYRAKVKETPGLLDYYSFEETFDDEVDGGNGFNNGVPAAPAPAFGDGLNSGGNCASFSGIGDVITIQRSIQNEFTVVAWLRTETAGIGGDASQFFEGSGVIYADVGGVANDFGTAVTGAKFAFGIGNPDMTIHSTTDVVTDRWLFVSVVRRVDAATSDLRLYVNGVLEESLEHTNRAALTAQARITIGGNTIDSRFFTGDVDEIGIFGSALDAAVIQTMFAAYTGITPCFTASAEEGPAPLSVAFDAACSRSSGAAITAFEWELGNGETSTGPQASAVYASPGIYTVLLKVTNADGIAAYFTRDIKVLFASGDVVPWTSKDVGSPPLPGGARLEDACMAVFSTGEVIIGQEDELGFVYQEKDGVVSLTARITAFQGQPLSRAGIMLRETTDPASAFVFAGIQEIQGVMRPSTVSRTRTGARSRPATGGLVMTPPDAYVRIERNGADFTTLASTDGQAWRQLQAVTFSAPPGLLLAGAAVVAERIPGGVSPAQATFCDLAIEAGPEGARFLRGDSDSSGEVNLTDAIRVLNVLFLGIGDITCSDSADADDSGSIDLTDAVRILNVLFQGAGTIPEPGPNTCGADPTADTDLDCVAPAVRCS